MVKRPRILIIDHVICELRLDDYFLEVDDPQEPVMLGNDDEFSDLEDINKENNEGNYIHTKRKRYLCLVSTNIATLIF